MRPCSSSYVRSPSSDGRDLPHLEARELLDVVTRRRAVPGEIVPDDTRGTSPRAGSGPRQGTEGDGFVCGQSPTGSVRTHGSARSANEIVQRSSVPSTRPASASSASSTGSSGHAAKSAAGSTPRPATRPRWDSMCADSMNGNRSRVDDVQRPAHDAGLDDRAVTESVRELLLAKARATRPERDVRRRCVLRLQRDEPRDHVEQGTAGSLEQQLPEQERAIQLAARERLKGSRPP